MSLEEATLARLPFDVAENIDIEEEKEEKRKVEEYKQAKAEHLKTVSKMAFTQQCIDDGIMPSKKQKRIIGKYTYGLRGMLFANINNTPDILYITCLLSILALTLSTIVTIGCASVRDEKALLEWLGTTTEDFHATFFHFILPIPIILLVLSLLQAFIIRSIPGQRAFSDDTKESGSLRLWNEKGEHKLFEKDFSGRYYEKEIEYFGTEVEANKFYNISDLITEQAEK